MTLNHVISSPALTQSNVVSVLDAMFVVWYITICMLGVQASTLLCWQHKQGSKKEWKCVLNRCYKVEGEHE